MRKIYIDAGSYKGKSIADFKLNYPNASEFEIHAFDPLVKCKGVTFHKQAVWIEDCKRRIYINTKKINAGSSLYKGKTTAKLDKKNPVLIDCIDFSNWIRKFDKTDFIVVAMNIEGSEYPVLGKMIEDRSIEWIDELFLSTHAGKLKKMEKTHKNLIKALKVEEVKLHITKKTCTFRKYV